MSTLIINTTNGSDIPAGYVQLNDNLRETTGKTISPEQRYRNVHIPELVLSSATEERFRPMLLEALYGVAKKKFEQINEQSNRMQRTVESSEFTLDALLSFYSTEATSGRMTREQVVAWFKESTTYALVLERKGEQKAQNWLNSFAKLSSPNHGLNASDCRVLLAGLQEPDQDTPIGKALAARLDSRIKASEQSTVDAL